MTPWECIPPGSSVHVIFQTRILEWVSISSYTTNVDKKKKRYYSVLCFIHLSSNFLQWVLSYSYRDFFKDKVSITHTIPIISNWFFHENCFVTCISSNLSVSPDCWIVGSIPLGTIFLLYFALQFWVQYSWTFFSFSLVTWPMSNKFDFSFLPDIANLWTCSLGLWTLL